ncbi:MAG: hypothetical protein COS34_05860 [Lysobacterales bacterium CG02_land_8_20_14_3_00_62_12]|nr:MAG: hypothetical protein COS34_05860 [Xanthomonadales bacterium CG02_land_8_20_14_3_00_62_12]
MTVATATSVKQCVGHADFAALRLALSQHWRSLDRAQAERLGAVAVSEGVAALLYAHADQPSASADHWLKPAAQMLALRELAHQAALSTVSAQLLKHSIPCLLIKGEALARSLYSTPAVRSRSDIDLWVDHQQLGPLQSILCQLGYPAVKQIVQHYARFEVVHGQATPYPIGFDLHVRPFFRPRLLDERPFAAVWQDASVLAELPGLRVPAASDSFLIAALHLARNPHKRWIWLYDIDQFCQREPAAVQRAGQQSVDWGYAALVADALRRAEQVFGTTPPLPLPRAVRFEPSAQLLRPQSRLAALGRDLRLLPNWRARGQFLTELPARPR